MSQSRWTILLTVLVVALELASSIAATATPGAYSAPSETAVPPKAAMVTPGAPRALTNLKAISYTLNLPPPPPPTPAVHSYIAEPSAAAVDEGRILASWNYWSAFRQDPGGPGEAWTYRDPADCCGPTAPHYGGFCCDQQVYYDQAHDALFWVQQYWPSTLGVSAIRIAFTRASTVDKYTQWCYRDFTQTLPRSVDRPYIGATNNWIWLLYQITENGVQVDSYSQRYHLTPSEFDPDPGTCRAATRVGVGLGGDTRPWAQILDGGDSMWFAAPLDSDHMTLRVKEIPGDVGGVRTWDHPIGPFADDPQSFNCPRVPGGGGNWCYRARPWPRGGWRRYVNDYSGIYEQIGFYWNAGVGFGYDHPYTRMILLNAYNGAKVDEVPYYHPEYALVYMSVAPDDGNQLAGSIMWGGNGNYQNCALVYRDNAWHPREPYFQREYPYYSYYDPNEDLGGDYLSARRHPHLQPPGYRLTWMSTCYQLLVSGAEEDVRVNVIRFYLPENW